MKRKLLATVSITTSMILGLSACAATGKQVGFFDNVDEYDARLFSLPGQGIVAEAAPTLAKEEVVAAVTEKAAEKAAEKAPEIAASPVEVQGFNDTASLLTFPDTSVPSIVTPEAQRGIASVSQTAPILKPAGFAPSSHEVTNADQAYAALIRGNERFIQGSLEHRNQSETRRRAIANEQRPFAVVLSSSDSRVPPELIFDQGLGDLYVIRVGGGVLGSAQVAAIEYAIENLGAKLILVLGNESSSEIQKALKVGQNDVAVEQTTDQKWLASEIKNNLKNGRFPAHYSEDPKLREAAKANVDSVTGLLYVRSSLVKKKIQSGEVKLVRGVYGVDTGKVEFWKFGEVPSTN